MKQDIIRLVRDRSTQENRDFWDFVDKTAAEVNRKWIHGDAVGSLTRYDIPKPMESITMEEIDVFRKLANRTLDITWDESLPLDRREKAKVFYQLIYDLIGDMLAKYRKEHGI